MADPFDNTGVFKLHPTSVLMALIPDRGRADHVIGALRAGGVQLDKVKVLHGEDGLRILDRRGDYHGVWARLQRLRQKLTYYDGILGLYAEGLTAGEFLIYVPTAPEGRREISQMLAGGRAHGVYYFGSGTVESLSGP